MTNPEQPISLNEPMPHRKVIREWLVPLSDRVTFGAIVLLLMDYAIWAGFLAGTVFFEAFFDVVVHVPATFGHLDVADAFFHEATGKQTALAELVAAIFFTQRLRLVIKAEGF